MSDYTQEQFDELPEFAKKDYIEVDGVYKHAGFVKVKQTANEIDKKAKDFESRYGELTGRLNDFESKEAEKIQQARKEAYDKARSEGNTDELERQWQEKLADAERRAGESETKYKDRMLGLAVKQQSAIASELSEHATTGGKAAFKRLVLSYIKVDAETGEETYLNDDGSASSLNKAQFIDELKKSEVFKPLIAATLSANGGGFAHGNNGGSAPGVSKKFQEYSGAELKEIRATNPTLYEELKAAHLNSK
jgi:hypothetical protein